MNMKKINFQILFYLLIFTNITAIEIRPGVFIPPQVYQVPGQPQEHTRRPSSTPYISGDTFRNMANFFVDQMRLPINPDNIKNGDIIFVVPDLLNYFFTELHPKITSRYILISHNGDVPAPGNYAYMLDDPKLIGWFAQNADIKYHPKLVHIPIGIANRYWPHGNIDILKELLPQIPSVKKTHLLYLNIALKNNPSVRNEVVQLFSTKSFCYSPAEKPWRSYLMDLAHSKFILSPRGNGLDCHRTWEALYMGSIPIVKTSTLDRLYEDLPVVIVNDWNEVNPEFLEKEYNEFKSKVFNAEKIYATYWINLIKSIQKQSSN